MQLMWFMRPFFLGISFSLMTITLLFGDDARTFRVDARGGADFRSLAEVASVVRPGDTIQIVPGSGPYRETLFIRQSGRPDAPITVDGGGELITGFDPLKGFHQENGQWVCELPCPFPCVLTYRGERLRQDATTKEFTRYAILASDGRHLILKDGVFPEGWEISIRREAVRILNSSYHVYRNIRTSGCLNDGFNLHGAGQELIFENIEAFQNLDEGFSAHDQIVCEIRQGNFWDNDNGIGNVASCSMKATDILSHNNLGWGVWLGKKTTSVLSNIKSWNNGITQYRFDLGSSVIGESLLAGKIFTMRQWVSYNESRNEASPHAVEIFSKEDYSGVMPKISSPEIFPDTHHP